MVVPKRRQSSSRRDKRRAHDSLSAPTIVACPQCSEPQRPHHVCEKCGFYKSKKIIEVKKV